jgi:cold shock CspA family protein
MDGRLVRIYKDLSYGFINSEGKDYFFHRSDYDGDWDALCLDRTHGIEVHLEFEPKRTDKGLRAAEVSLSDV